MNKLLNFFPITFAVAIALFFPHVTFAAPPTISFLATPGTVYATPITNVSLTWSSSGAQSCTLTRQNPDNSLQTISIGGATSGSKTIQGFSYGFTTFRLKCIKGTEFKEELRTITGIQGTGFGGGNIFQCNLPLGCVSVTPIAIPSSVNLLTDKSTIVSGENVTLSWSPAFLSDATHILATDIINYGPVNSPASGSAIAKPTQTTTYTAVSTWGYQTVYGYAGGSAYSYSRTVTVQAPTCTWQYVDGSDTKDLNNNVSNYCALSSIKSLPQCGSGLSASSDGTSAPPGSPQACKLSDCEKLRKVGSGCSISLNATCSASPTSITTGQSSTWVADPSGGTGTYTYSWSGTSGLSGTAQSVSRAYSTAGTKTATVIVTSGGISKTVSCSNSVIVSAPTPQCSNGIDDDGDGFIDNADYGCYSGGNSYNPNDTSESPNPQCSDGIDNNSNGFIDYANGDPACSSPYDNNEQTLPNASISLSAPSLVQPQATVVLSWSATNTSSCTLAGTNGDSWTLTGSSGTKTTSPLSSQAIFTLSCVDLNGNAVSSTTTVRLTPSFEEI